MEYKGRMIYEEAPDAADGYRQAYIQGIEKYISNMNCRSRKLREDRMPLHAFPEAQERFRGEYRKMLGLDVFSVAAEKAPEVTYVASDDICDIFRLVAYPQKEIPFYAMLLIPHGAGRPVPLVIAQHGGGGTPELCADMNGKNNYNHMVQRILERGAAVLAPQLLLWSKTEQEGQRAHPIPFDRHKLDWNLKRFGTSITALEICGILRAMEAALSFAQIDGDRVGMIGLSYGGYYTLHTMAADWRICAGYAAGAFNDRDIYSWEDWCYPGSADMFQDAEVAGLCAPRRLYIQVGKEDPVFDYRSAVTEGERVQKYFDAFGCSDNFVFDLWDGGHTISDSDRGIDFLFEALA